MAKQGMSRPEWTKPGHKGRDASVPELQGKAKHGKEKVKPIVSGTAGANMKVYHTTKPIPTDPYPAYDTELAQENLCNDIPAADLEDL